MAKNNNKGWTPKQERILLKAINAKGTNLKEAFENAAPLIGKTTGAVTAHYYEVLRKKVNNVVGVKTKGRKVSNNVKNSPRTPVAGGTSLGVEILEELIGGFTRADKKALVLRLLK